MKSTWRRGVSLILVMVLCLGTFAPAALAADQVPEPLPLADLSASADNNVTGAVIGWTNDALPQSTMAALINSQELHPQRTGYVEMDNKIDKILEPYQGKPAYEQIQAVYLWIINNVVYTHNGYGFVEGATNQYDYLTKTDYVLRMTYETGLEHAIPDKVINHASYALFENKGACYDFASLMAVAIRHIGINAYVHTGYWVLESDGSRNNHHGWTEIELNGKLYIIDPQREARYTEKMGSLQNIYFGIPHENGADWRYWSPDIVENAVRDALFLPVTAEREDPATPVTPVDPVDPGAPTDPENPETDITLRIVVSGSGSVTCNGTPVAENTYAFKSGDKVHLEAVPGAHSAFRSWWDKNMKDYLLAVNPDYVGASQISADEGVTFFLDESLAAVDGTVVIEALFENTVELRVVSSRSGSVKCDGADVAEVQEHLIGDQVVLSAQSAQNKAFAGWYDSYGNLLSEEPSYSITTLQNCTLYALFAGDVFCDIKSDEWYLEYAMESAQKGLVNGTTAVTFEGELTLTRAMAVTILARMEQPDMTQVPASTFTDVPEDSYFYDAVNWATANGIVEGRSAACFDPDTGISRQEFVAIVVRYLEWKGYELDQEELAYTDNADFDEYAVPYAEKAQSLGLVSGYPEGDFRPDAKLLRQEGVKIVVLLGRYLEENPANS